jgi:hypothetical protein
MKLAEKGLFSPFLSIEFISDNCGKHFKTYQTHVFIAQLQKELGIDISYYFLGPGDAHNACDASIAHVKKAVRKVLVSRNILSETAHLAHCLSRLHNFYLLEIFAEEFPPAIVCVPSESFIQNNFDFKYRDFSSEKSCKHACLNPCKHSCCVKKDVCNLLCKDRKGVERPFKIFFKEGDFEDVVEDAVDFDKYWDTSKTHEKHWKPANEKRTTGIFIKTFLQFFKGQHITFIQKKHFII